MNKCHDCGIAEGEIHQFGCDMEEHAACGGQLITCGCVYEALGINVSPGTWAYKNGLTEWQELQWLGILEEQGRVPYIVYPTICCRCGELWPDHFSVSNEEWIKYIPLRHRGSVLCIKCYDMIKSLIDSHKPKGADR